MRARHWEQRTTRHEALLDEVRELAEAFLDEVTVGRSNISASTRGHFSGVADTGVAALARMLLRERLRTRIVRPATLLRRHRLWFRRTPADRAEPPHAIESNQPQALGDDSHDDLGATKGHIRIQFLTEAMLLALLGGAAGVGLGVAATAVYAHTQHWATVIPPLAWAGGLASALLIGAIAGLLPAIRAARMSPTQALWSM